MSGRVSGWFLLGCSAWLLAGCGAGKRPVEEPPPSATAGQVTLHVEGMTERQAITWPTWPNRVHEALSGLPGVESVKADLKRDLLHVRYDAEKVSPEDMLRMVDEQGFQGKVMTGDPETPTPWDEDGGRTNGFPFPIDPDLLLTRIGR